MVPYYTLKNLFFAELIGKYFYIPSGFYIPLALGNVLLVWLIAKKFLGRKFALLCPFVIILSPWFYYLAFAHSFYIFLLFLTLLVTIGFLQIVSDQKTLGSVLVIIGSTIAIYISVLFLPLLTILFAASISFKILSFRNLKISIIFLAFLCLPLLILIGKNKVGFINSLSREVKIFSDPGLINSVNRYQGAAEKNGFKILSRISENKYLFFTEYVFLKYTSQLVPETYFTPKDKLLGFSFSPPIFIGFLIPFTYGLYLALKRPDLRKILFVSTFLTIPSILAKDLVALNRLVLFSPVLFLLISYGLACLYKERKNMAARNFLVLTSLLIIFQLLVTISDIHFREGKRFETYFGNKYELAEP